MFAQGAARSERPFAVGAHKSEYQPLLVNRPLAKIPRYRMSVGWRRGCNPGRGGPVCPPCWGRTGVPAPNRAHTWVRPYIAPT